MMKAKLKYDYIDGDEGVVVFIDLLCMIYQRTLYLIFPGFKLEFSQDVPAFVFERSCLTHSHYWWQVVPEPSFLSSPSGGWHLARWICNKTFRTFCKIQNIRQTLETSYL